MTQKKNFDKQYDDYINDEKTIYDE